MTKALATIPMVINRDPVTEVRQTPSVDTRIPAKIPGIKQKIVKSLSVK